MNKILTKIKQMMDNQQRLYLIDTYKKFMKNGKYKIDSSGTRVYLKNINFSKVSTFEANVKKSWISKMLIRLISIFTTNITYCLDDIEEKSFLGELLLIGTSNKEVKIFNITDKIILTFFNDEDRYKNIIDKRKYINKLFNTPKILKEQEQMIEEEMLETQEFNKLDVINKILDVYKQNVSIIKCEKIYIKNSRINKINFFKEIYDNYVVKLQEDMKFIRSHGDLWSANILYNNNQIYVIDYEAVDTYSYLYDFLIYIYNLYNINDDISLLNYYICGYFDEQIKDFAKALNAKYDSRKKKEYFLFFIYEFATHRFIEYNDKQLNKEIQKIKIIIDKF